jgi:hypothetical protein
MKAFDEVYELLQAKALTEEQLLKAEGYMVLARLAEVNEVILRDAGDEEVFEKLEALEQACSHRSFSQCTTRLTVLAAIWVNPPFPEPNSHRLVTEIPNSSWTTR